MRVTHRDILLGAKCPHLDKKTSHRVAPGAVVHRHDVLLQRKNFAVALKMCFLNRQRVVWKVGGYAVIDSIR
jgi:hypothetical protein